MSAKISLLAILVVTATVVAADTLELRPDHPRSYTVVKGDTLWDISGRFLTEPWRWPELWQANPQIENPHLIYPGDVLTLTWEGGRPRLRLGGTPGGRYLKLTPQVREYRRDGAIAPIPLDAIRQFLSEPRVVEEGQLTAAPYIVSSEDQHLVNGSGARVYVRGVSSDGPTRYGVFRGGKVYRDPDAGDAVIGYEALHVGNAVLERFGDPATARIITAKREVLNGDRLLPLTEESVPTFVPRAPEAAVEARIISVIDGVSEIGQHQVVVLSAGREHGLEPGHVLGIFRTGEVVQDRIGPELERARADRIKVGEDRMWIEKALGALFTDVRNTKRMVDETFGVELSGAGEAVELPEERSGDLIVFRTFDRVSYGLVMEIVRPVHVFDRVRNP